MMNPDGTVALLPFLLALLTVCAVLYLTIYVGGTLLGMRLLDRPKRRGTPPPARRAHEPWCDTNMPDAADWASAGVPIRCNCDDTGPGSFREVIRTFDAFREADRAAQRALGVVLPPLPDAETLARGGLDAEAEPGSGPGKG